MKSIFKFELAEYGNNVLTAQPGVVRHVGERHGILTVWIEVDRSVRGLHQYHFDIFGTGHDIPDTYEGQYIGTVQMSTGLVWHIYER